MHMIEASHVEITPKILYYGTPVLLLTTQNEDGSSNISPLSSSWSLGHYIVLGVGVGGKALENLQRHPECVINLPGPDLWKNVENLASLTGVKDVPDYKKAMNFRYCKDKFQAANVTPLPSVEVQPDRILECPIHLEARIMDIRIPDEQPTFAIVEAKVLRVHAASHLVVNDNHIDPMAWSPLLYNFRHYFGLGTHLGKTFRAEI